MKSLRLYLIYLMNTKGELSADRVIISVQGTLADPSIKGISCINQVQFISKNGENHEFVYVCFTYKSQHLNLVAIGVEFQRNYTKFPIFCAYEQLLQNHFEQGIRIKFLMLL